MWLEKTGKYLHYLTIATAAIALPNFFAFVFIALYIGGDAINGHVTDGHYFLANHGKYTEVTYNVFLYSRIHAISVIFTHSVCMLVCGFAYLRKSKLAH